MKSGYSGPVFTEKKEKYLRHISHSYTGDSLPGCMLTMCVFRVSHLVTPANRPQKAQTRAADLLS